MFCSSCGTAVTPGLSYCNRCGAELGAKGRQALKPSEASLESLVWAVVSVTVGGIGAVMVLLAVMKEVFGTPLLIVFTALSFLLVLAAEVVLIRMLLRRGGGAKDAGDAEQLRGQETKELGAARERALPGPGLSVTDHATRTFEPARAGRKAE